MLPGLYITGRGALGELLEQPSHWARTTPVIVTVKRSRSAAKWMLVGKAKRWGPLRLGYRAAIHVLEIGCGDRAMHSPRLWRRNQIGHRRREAFQKRRFVLQAWSDYVRPFRDPSPHMRVADFGPLERMGRPLGECLWKPTHHELQDGPGNYGAKLARQLISTMGNTEPS